MAQKRLTNIEKEAIELDIYTQLKHRVKDLVLTFNDKEHFFKNKFCKIRFNKEHISVIDCWYGYWEYLSYGPTINKKYKLAKQLYKKQIKLTKYHKRNGEYIIDDFEILK